MWLCHQNFFFKIKFDLNQIKLRVHLQMWLCQSATQTKTLPVLSNNMKERNRINMLEKCTHSVVTQLPWNKPWGLIIGDGGFGMLYVVGVKKKSAAFDAGIRKDDFLYKFEGNLIDVMHTPQSLTPFVHETKQRLQRSVCLHIMRC